MTQTTANAQNALASLTPEQITLLMSMNSSQLQEISKIKKKEESIEYIEHAPINRDTLGEDLGLEFYTTADVEDDDLEIDEKMVNYDTFEKKYKMKNEEDWTNFVKKNPKVQEHINSQMWDIMKEWDDCDFLNVRLNCFTRDELIKNKKKCGCKSYETGDRKMAKKPAEGCNFIMKDGEECGGETTGKAKCMCRRHNGNLHLDITQRGLYPLVDKQGMTMDKDNKKKVKATNKTFMLPTAFKKYMDSEVIDYEDVKRNPLLYVLYKAGWYDNINGDDKAKRSELFNMYNSKNKHDLLQKAKGDLGLVNYITTSTLNTKNDSVMNEIMDTESENEIEEIEEQDEEEI